MGRESYRKDGEIQGWEGEGEGARKWGIIFGDARLRYWSTEIWCLYGATWDYGSERRVHEYSLN